MNAARKVRQRAMVGWYDPRVLMQSAYQVAIANIFGPWAAIVIGGRGRWTEPGMTSASAHR